MGSPLEVIMTLVIVVGALPDATAVNQSQPAPVNWSTPAGTFHSLQHALTTNDFDLIAQGMYYFGGPGEAELRTLLADERGRELTEYLKRRFVALSIRQIDRRVPYILKQEMKLMSPPIDEVCRLLCNVTETDGWDPGFMPGRGYVASLYFVRFGDRWKWHFDLYVRVKTWHYDFSTPKKCFNAVLQATDQHDAVGVYDMIDPDMLAGKERKELLAAARQRLAQLDEWENDQAAEMRAADEAGRKLPRLSPPPFKRSPGRKTSANETELFSRSGQQMARVVQVHPQTKAPVDAEEFVQHGDRWYWRPKPEYDAWPLDPPASQPSSVPANE